MSIPELLAKIKLRKDKLVDGVEDSQIYFPIILILVALASYGLGRLSLLEESHTPVRITGGETSTLVAKDAPIAAAQVAGAIVASRNGTRYYYPGCSGANRIAEANKITFTTKEEAERSGFTLASGCSAR